MITSVHNPRLQLVRRLVGGARQRRENGCFIAEGARLVEEAHATGWSFRFVLAGESLPGRSQSLINDLITAGMVVEQVSDRLIQAVSDTENSQGVLAVVEQKQLPFPDQLNCVLILDQVRDPGNLGTLLRTAVAAGFQAVLLSPRTADAFAPKVVRAGMGAHFRLPIRSADWQEIRAQVHGLQVCLAEVDRGVDIWKADLRQPTALVIGGEAQGASQESRALATQFVTIPMPGGSESLNAAAAGAILMFEVVRQRLQS